VYQYSLHPSDYSTAYAVLHIMLLLLELHMPCLAV